jgi:hypothetical protein
MQFKKFQFVEFQVIKKSFRFLCGSQENNPVEKVMIKYVYIDNKKVTTVDQIDLSGQAFKRIEFT